MKKLTLALLGATTAFALSSGAANAYTATIYDALNRPGVAPYSHGSTSGANGSWGDHWNGAEGAGGDFFSGNIDVTWSGADVILKINSSMPANGSQFNGKYFGFADIFIDVASDGVLKSGNETDWDYGIDIDSVGTGGGGFSQDTESVSGKDYVRTAASAGGGTKARLVKDPGIAYANRANGISHTKICDDTDASCNNGDAGRTPEVEVTTGEVQKTVVTIAQESDNTPPPAYFYTITLYGVNIGGKWDEFRLFWGTGWCANDTVEGVAKIPVPAALPIIGAALAGFGFAGWRQRKAA